MRLSNWLMNGMINMRKIVLILVCLVIIIGGALAIGHYVSQSSTISPKDFAVNHRHVYVYGKMSAYKKQPLILYLNSTGGSPRKEPIQTGWAKLARQKNLIVVSPKYNDAVTYDEVPFFLQVVQAAKKRFHVDNSRIYVVGFSNGGASAVALTNAHAKKFAGIAAYGWMVDLKKVHGSAMPFQLLQGTREFTVKDSTGHPMIMQDERHAVRSLLLRNKMIASDHKADYQRTSY